MKKLIGLIFLGDGIAEELSRVRRASSSSHRNSRLLTQKRNIEILVVADRTMVKKYGTEEATTYILTVMNMVQYIHHLDFVNI